MIIILIPFLEFLLPALIVVFPNMLPSTFESKYQKVMNHFCLSTKQEEKKKKLLKVRLEVAKFLQDTVGETALHGSSKAKDSQEFVDFFHKWRISGDQAPTEDVIKIAKVSFPLNIFH